MLRGKAMGSKAGDMVEIMADLLTRARLDDKVRGRGACCGRRAAAPRAGPPAAGSARRARLC